MATNTNDPRGGERRRPQHAGGTSAGRARPAPRKGFQKERATLWLLTLTLGLGLGTALRFVQRADQARAAGAAAPVAGGQAVSNASVPYQNQRVAVLPQPGYGYRARATSRMS